LEWNGVRFVILVMGINKAATTPHVNGSGLSVAEPQDTWPVV
jgi:hypothetical protein